MNSSGIHNSFQTEVHFSKGKLFFKILMAAGLITLTTASLVRSATTNSPFPRELRFSGLFLFVIGVFILIKSIRRFIISEPAILLNGKGIVLNTLKFQRQSFIPWETVKAAEVVSVKGTKLLVVIVNNPIEVIGNQSNIMVQFFLKWSYWAHKTPFGFSCWDLTQSAEEIKTAIDKRFILQ
jgi:hypothetical protein